MSTVSDSPPTTGSAPIADSPADADPRPTTDVVGSLVDDIRSIFRGEAALARHELEQALSARLQAAAAGAVAGVLALFALGFAAAAGAFALAEVLPAWAAWAIVAGIFLLVAGLGGFVAARRATRPPMAPEAAIASFDNTREQVEDHLAHVKERIRG